MGYLKTKKVDMKTKAHGEGTCSTYKGDGSFLDEKGMVARSEGHNLASFKPQDCPDDEFDTCFEETPTKDDCHTHCHDVKDYYKKQKCCGSPDKELNPNEP